MSSFWPWRRCVWFSLLAFRCPMLSRSDLFSSVPHPHVARLVRRARSPPWSVCQTPVPTPPAAPTRDAAATPALLATHQQLVEREVGVHQLVGAFRSCLNLSALYGVGAPLPLQHQRAVQLGVLGHPARDSLCCASLTSASSSTLQLLHVMHLHLPTRDRQYLSECLLAVGVYVGSRNRAASKGHQVVGVLRFCYLPCFSPSLLLPARCLRRTISR